MHVHELKVYVECAAL